MKITKKMMAAALALALALCMAGCELPMMGFDDYDVSSYIQALLDRITAPASLSFNTASAV